MIHLWADFLFSCFYSYHWNGSVLILSIHVCRTKQIHKCKCHKASIKAYSELPRYKESVKTKSRHKQVNLRILPTFICAKKKIVQGFPLGDLLTRERDCLQNTIDIPSHTLTFSSELKMGFSHSAKVVIISEKAAAFY